jgi:hypothetical protein
MGGGDPRAPSNPMIVDFLDDWDLVSGVRLQETKRRIRWKLNSAGMNTSKFAYEDFFYGRTRELVATELWSAVVSLKYKMHMWFC